MVDVVERLRQLEVRITAGANEVCGQAADRIEQDAAAIAALRARLAEAERLLDQTLAAIDTGRSEPLFIMRDVVRNHIEDRTAWEAGNEG